MLLALLISLLSLDATGDLPQRQAYLEELRAILPPSKPWEDWLDESGELPPNFAAMPSYAPLPELLADSFSPNAALVATPEAWAVRREVLLKEFKHWVFGTVPPPPDNAEAKILSEIREDGAIVQEIELRFGPDHAAKLSLTLMIPEGDGPFPVFMSQHNHMAWGRIALQRGYIACVYAGADSRDDTDTFIDAYPEHDWSKLARRAWAASRCIDYLETVSQADAGKIALTGHSRNGKLSLIASALDERIAVVISSSSGAGGSMATRYYSEQHFGEGIENITRSFPDWFHPRLRFFVGREDKLPVDLHQLVGLSAPRPCLISTAINDGVESTWAIEQTYHAVKPTYEMLGHPENLRILYRPGGHGTWPTVIEYFLDWCDLHFGRGNKEFPERIIHPHDWDTWAAQQEAPHLEAFPIRPYKAPLPPEGEEVWEAEAMRIRAAVRDMLGSAPTARAAVDETYGLEPADAEQLLRRSEIASGLVKDDLMFGAYVNADVYMPEGTKESGKKLPTVLWLHPMSLPGGYVAAYKRGEQVFNTLARAGYAVFCYDQIGFGRRIEEVDGFYGRYPDWSLLAKMTEDAHRAIDKIASLPYVDTDQIFVCGYGLGAYVALHLGAIDARPAGYALVAPPPPYRLDKDVAATGGIARWSKVHMLVPQLGHFVGQEDRVPYDLNELFALLLPRLTLLVTPRLDREGSTARLADIWSIRNTIAASVTDEVMIQVQIPETYTHCDPTVQQYVVDWLNKVAKKP